MTRKLVYVSGPYRGQDAWEVETNVRRAEVMGMRLAQLGAVPVIPHAMFRFWHGTIDDQPWLDATLRLLRHCDAVVMLDGWESSLGSSAEYHEAQRIGLVVCLEPAVGSVQFREWVEQL